MTCDGKSAMRILGLYKCIWHYNSEISASQVRRDNWVREKNVELFRVEEVRVALHKWDDLAVRFYFLKLKKEKIFLGGCKYKQLFKKINKKGAYPDTRRQEDASWTIARNTHS
jgi:hypothetical protein